MHTCRWFGAPPLVVGACAVPLSEIASGPIKYDLPLLDASGAPCGRLVFAVKMMQRCKLLMLTRLHQITPDHARSREVAVPGVSC